ncbi:MAG: hypothetical protein BGP07_12980 [Rhizobiales bacterium 63-22]|nr:MAG: hypothetical protein BGP07_12980 [Rhizobiales bacterium 63-22]
MLPQFQRVLAAVDDDKRLFRIAQSGDKRVIAHFSGLNDLGSPQRGRQGLRIGCKLTPLQRQAVAKLALVEGRLRGRTQYDAATVIECKFIQHAQARQKQSTRQRLGFIQYNDAVRYIVELARPRSFCGEKAFEKLHIRRHDDRRGPVLHRQL